MKQLLIVNSAKALNAKVGSGSVTPLDLSGLDVGAITFFELGASTALAASPTKNFGIALGGGANKMPFVIPEVDYDSVQVTKAVYDTGAAFTATMVVPTVAAGLTYTIILVKNGTVPHERNTWTATYTALTGDSASDVAAKLRAYFKAMSDSGSLNVTVSGSGANVIITGNKVGEGWTLKGADALLAVAATSVTPAEPAIGDKDYILDLASRCAAGKGFTDTHEFGPSVYPGYPELVEDTTYNVYTLRFQVGRASAKTRDEKVWQLVHIAVPSGATAASDIDDILTKIKAPVTAEAAAEVDNNG